MELLFCCKKWSKSCSMWYKRRKKGDWKVTITYGKPLDFSKYKGTKDKETLDKVTSEIMDNIISLTK